MQTVDTLGSKTSRTCFGTERVAKCDVLLWQAGRRKKVTHVETGQWDLLRSCEALIGIGELYHSVYVVFVIM